MGEWVKHGLVLPPDPTVEWRSGGGCLTAVGVPVLLGGIVMALGAVGAIPLKDEFGHP